jgi:hypothetical protein
VIITARTETVADFHKPARQVFKDPIVLVQAPLLCVQTTVCGEQSVDPTMIGTNQITDDKTLRKCGYNPH